MFAKALALAAASAASASPATIESTVALPGDVVFGCMCLLQQLPRTVFGLFLSTDGNARYIAHDVLQSPWRRLLSKALGGARSRYGEQFGENAARLRISLPTDNECPAEAVDGLPGALQPNPSGLGAKRVAVKLTGEAGSSPTTLVSGNLELQLSPEGIHVVRRSDNRPLTSMQRLQVSGTPELGWYSFNVTWEAFPGERTFGLGENAYSGGQRTLDNRGLAIDLHQHQHNTHITIPHAISSREYGMFLNHPGWGAIDMTSPSRTVWALSMARQIDYIFTTSAAPLTPSSLASPFADIMEAYYGAIGLPTQLPDWALGFWASKERYSSQAEILSTVHNYTSIHGIDVSVLVIDWKTYVRSIFDGHKTNTMPRFPQSSEAAQLTMPRFPQSSEAAQPEGTLVPSGPATAASHTSAPSTGTTASAIGISPSILRLAGRILPIWWQSSRRWASKR
jgi:alpha-glucosidase (family GH31 glycosyl hydrolase)